MHFGSMFHGAFLVQELISCYLAVDGFGERFASPGEMQLPLAPTVPSPLFPALHEHAPAKPHYSFPNASPRLLTAGAHGFFPRGCSVLATTSTSFHQVASYLPLKASPSCLPSASPSLSHLSFLVTSLHLVLAFIVAIVLSCLRLSASPTRL